MTAQQITVIEPIVRIAENVTLYGEDRRWYRYT